MPPKKPSSRPSLSRPSWIAALKKIAPKKRRAKIPWIIALGLIGTIAVLACDPEVRAFAYEKARPRITAALVKVRATLAELRDRYVRGSPRTR